MHPAHIIVSVAITACGLVAYVDLVLGPTYATLWVFAAIAGFLVSLVAFAIAVPLPILLCIRSTEGEGRAFLARQWLGLVNGAVVAVFWISLAARLKDVIE